MDETLPHHNNSKSLYLISTNDHLLTFCSFIVFGASAMIFWQMLIGSLYSIQVFLFPDKVDISDSITGVYTTLSLVSTASLIYFQVLNSKLFYVGSCGFVASLVGVIIVCWCFNGSTVGLVLFHVFALIGGSCTAFFESSIFGLASILPRNYIGGISIGLGLAGLISFALWIILSKVIFGEGLVQTQHSILVFMLIGALINISSMVLFTWLLKRPWARISREEAISMAKAKSAPPPNYDVVAAQESLVANTNFRAKRSKWAVFKDVSEQLFNISFTLFITLMLFPNISPFAWGQSVLKTDFLMGIMQVGDCVGRYIPNLRRWIKYCTVKPKNLKYYSIARIIFIPLFILPYKIPDVKVLSNYTTQVILMVIFSLSNGWICTQSSMYVPDCVIDKDEKGEASVMYLLCLLSGITIGVWMVKLIRL